MRCTIITGDGCSTEAVIRAETPNCEHVVGCCSTHFFALRSLATGDLDGVQLYCTVCYGDEKYYMKDVRWF